MPTATTDKISLQQVQSVLPPKRGDKYECPSCGEWHLTVKEADGRVLVHCFTPGCQAGAAWEQIKSKLRRLKPPKAYVNPSGPGLTVEAYAAAKRLPADWLITFFLLSDGEYQGVPAVAFPYGSHTKHREVRSKREPDGSWKATPHGDIVWTGNVKWRWGMGGDERRWQKGSKAELYGEFQLAYAERERKAAGEPLLDYCFIVEGESDTQTLAYNDFPVLGVSGAPSWPNSPLLTGKKILVIEEPEDAAKVLTKKIANSLPNGDVRVVKLQVKDVSQLWQDVHADYGFDEKTVKEVFKQRLDEAIAKSTVVNPTEGEWQIETISADKVEPKVFEWLWEDRIPLNKFTLFFGLPGQGKSTVAIDVAASLTTGRGFGDRENNTPPSDVLMLIAEDELDDTVVPRLMAAKAERSRIHFVMMTSLVEGATRKERRLALDRDMKAVERKLSQMPDVRLLVIDPVSSYLGNVNPNKSNEVRPLLESLKDLARKANVTVLGIAHFNKNADQETIHRISGAGAWGEVPRALWGFVPKPVEENTKPEDLDEPPALMLNAKLNNTSANRRHGLIFKIEEVLLPLGDKTTRTSHIKWIGKATETLKGVMDAAKSSPGRKPVKTEEAMTWLKSYLADGGRLSNDIFDDGEKAHHKKDTLYEAKKRLGVVASGNPKTGWTWALPGVESDLVY